MALTNMSTFGNRIFRVFFVNDTEVYAATFLSIHILDKDNISLGCLVMDRLDESDKTYRFLV